jgi:hypothetical protein
MTLTILVENLKLMFLFSRMIIILLMPCSVQKQSKKIEKQVNTTDKRQKNRPIWL